MNKFIDYIEDSCSKLGEGQSVYRYKKKLLDEMTARENEYIRAGLKDENVIKDLITDEYPDPEADFPKYEKQQRKEKLVKKGFPIGGIISFVLIFITYFTVSGLTSQWDKTWLIIVGGIFAMIIFYLSFAVAELCKMRRVFHPIARLLIIGCTVIFSVFMFLFFLMMIPEAITWPIIPGGIILALIADLIFAFITKQKFRTISLFVYMPSISALLYVIFSAYGFVPWSTGWPIVLLGLAADLVYILIVLINNAKYFVYKQEVDE